MGGEPVQGTESNQEHYENLRRIAEASEKLAKSSERLESGTKNLLWLTIVLVGLTILLAVMTYITVDVAYKQFTIDNPPPEISVEGRTIILGTGLRPEFEFPDGIVVSAVSNHNLKFTVTNVTLNYVNGEAGTCFFDSGPRVSIWRPVSVILEKDEDLKHIQPELTITYGVRSPFIGIINATNKLGHVVGAITFDVIITDLQDSTKSYHRQAWSDLVVYWPEDRFQTAIKRCVSEIPS